MSESPSPLLRAVEVMDRLRSPGGCPWDAAQTHESLAPYLLEETYETLEAIETDDLELLREELGDLLLQILFHARLAEELPPDQRFSIDDVASDLVAKLIRRHPHVFSPSSSDALDAAAVNERWDQLKAAEKQRESVTDGVPMSQPALSLAAKLVSRAHKAGLDADTAHVTNADVPDIGARLFNVVRDAVSAGIDPELALRTTARAYRAALLRSENAPSDKAESADLTGRQPS